jgi:hypothetical protein
MVSSCNKAILFKFKTAVDVAGKNTFRIRIYKTIMHLTGKKRPKTRRINGDREEYMAGGRRRFNQSFMNLSQK